MDVITATAVSSSSGTATSSHPGLTTAQSIGIGVAIGFVAASLVYAIAVWLTRSAALSLRFTPHSNLSNSQAALIRRLRPWKVFRPGLVPPTPTRPYVPSIQAPPPRPIPGYRRIGFYTPYQVEDTLTSTHLVINFARCAFIGTSSSRSKAEVEAVLDEAQLVRLAGAPVNGGTWTELISDRKTRAPAVASFLFQVLYARMHPSCDIEKTLLPVELASFYQYLCNFVSELDPGYKDSVLMALWREITCTFYFERLDIRYEETTSGFSCEDDPRFLKAGALAEEVLDALKIDVVKAVSIWHENSNTDIFQTLRYLIGVAANDAMVLFSQPSNWTYDWIPERPGFITHPGIHLVIEKIKVDMFAGVYEYLPNWRREQDEVAPSEHVEDGQATVGE